ncbi:tetratricopeptide repeat protein [Nocardia colli]|uniref:Tetratricopeptide repeat protein n=1 Tax=Nocardia colli TaxID=2545717 RepID=A0A5N0E6S3_9NOCA|nr:tetratricopeptide repeat protein [Nocardia colli]KAA8884400.1 tetratricopeptide repeat protein [Nocardia colli]
MRGEISETGGGGEGSSPRALFVTRLAELWDAAGNPTLQRVAATTEARLKAARTPAQSQRSSMQRISDWRSGRNVPSRFEALDPVLVTLIALARQTTGPVPADLSNRSTWRRVWKAAIAQPVRPTVTTSLRRDVPTFVGRDAEVQRILDAAGPGRVVSIHTIDGMPGVGKTALVTRAGHLLTDRFPDGRFFVELNTHTPGQTPADPTDVLATLLTGLGIAPSHIPDTLAARSDLWRDRVAAKRILLVLDDARDHAQIEPLLPAGPECLTLITSRRRLVALDDALPLPLDTLEPDNAIDLFCQLAQRNPQGDDVAAVAEIVRLCGYLPLAIVLLAGRLAHHPAWTLAGLAEEFRTAQDRLGELDAGQRAVRAAFTASYESLPPQRQQLFGRLGLHPGLDFDAYAVAALNDIPLTEARSELDALYTDNLIEETKPGRYGMHDLVREYVRALGAAAPLSTEAVQRVLDYYQATAAAADRWLTRRPRPADGNYPPGRTSALVREFDDERRALAWMRMERANLLACLEYAADHDPARMVGLTEVLAELLEREGPWPTAHKLHQRAVEAAGQLGNHLGRANALTNLAIVQWQSGRYEYEQAADLLRQALALYRATGYPIGEGNTLITLGGLHRYTGDYRQSADLIQQALTLFQATGHRIGEADALARLGGLHRDTGDYRQSADLIQQALIVFRETGYRLGEAGALSMLGGVHREAGDYGEATDLLLRAAALFREIGNPSGEATALGNLGLVRREIGDHAQAADLIQRALAVCQEIGHRLGEAINLNNLATVRRETADLEQAADLSQQALILFRETGFRIGEAEALANLGAVCLETGDHDRAADLSRQALNLFREIGYRVKEAETLNNLARALSASGKPGEALTVFTEASTVAADTDNRTEQARAAEGIADCRAAL